MRASMYQRAPTTISSTLMSYPNYPFFMSSFGSDDDNESDEQFNFNISRELLLDPNDVVVGEMIGEGGNSIVHKGLYKNNNPVAVKIVQPSRTSALNIEQKEKFQNEVMFLSSMKHDNIVKFVGACIEPQLMIVTELLEGGTLQRFMLNTRPNPFDLKMSLSFALEISRAMEFLHSNGIIHRDINPRNVLVTADMKDVKLTGFGLATEKTLGGMACEVGTYRWMAPEVCSREPLKIGEKKHYDHKVDVYSFGLLLWALLTNKTPFSDINHISVPYFVHKGVRPSLIDIPNEIAFILESCWAEDSNARPEFKDITILLKNLLRNLCSDSTTSSDITTVIIKEEACDSEIEYPKTTVLIEKRHCKVKKPKKKKKKMVKMVLTFFIKTLFCSKISKKGF